MSLRAVRSPLAPKMTMEHSSTGLRASPNEQVAGSSDIVDGLTDERCASQDRISTPERPSPVRLPGRAQRLEALGLEAKGEVTPPLLRYRGSPEGGGRAWDGAICAAPWLRSAGSARGSRCTSCRFPPACARSRPPGRNAFREFSARAR